MPGIFLLATSGQVRSDTEPAQETRSDRKDAKSVIHDMLGPRRPWRGTLSSSDRVPCALSLCVAARITLIEVFVLSETPGSAGRFY
jgi:hypothetical protein